MSSHRSDTFHIPTVLQGKVANEYYQYIQLSRGIEEGNVEAVKDFLNKRPDSVDQWINLHETPLLKACACGETEIVKELLNRMTPEQMFTKRMTKEEEYYHSPLTVAAGNGNMQIAEALIAKNPKVLEIPGVYNEIPVVVAIESTQVEMARYLYTRTPIQVLFDKDGIYGAKLLSSAILFKMFDIALDLFGICRRLAVVRVLRSIISLAIKPDLFKGGCQDLGPLKRLIYSCLLVKLPTLPKLYPSTRDENTTLLGKLLNYLLKWTGIEEVYQLKVMHMQVKKLMRGISEETLSMDLNDRPEVVENALKYAVAYGNIEFLVEMVKNNSELLLTTKRYFSNSLFFLAIKYRQKEVLNFLYGLKQRDLLFIEDTCYGFRNGALPLVSNLAPPERLATIAGAASQMQSELKWFMEIERISLQIETDRSSILKGDTRHTPFNMFSWDHTQLRQEAEKSMKDMAGSCSLVAALIVTVTFAAVFTVPGGIDEKEHGTPIHIKEQRFMIFIVSDMISCFTACTSVLIFLGILTSRYDFKDFLVSLPTKMIAGLTLMFISIAAMLIAFWSALFTILNQKSWLVAPVVVVACFPAVLFVRLQYPLLKEMIILTYGKGILDMKSPSTNNRSIGSQAKTFILQVMSSSINYLRCRLNE